MDHPAIGMNRATTGMNRPATALDCPTTGMDGWRLAWIAKKQA
jgi:hypothetical protein